MSEVSGLCLSVFVTSDQWMLWFTAICCCFLLVLMVYALITNFSHVGKISCLLGLNHYQAADEQSCSSTQHCKSAKSLELGSSKREWSGNTTITNCRPIHGTVRMSHRTFTVTKHPKDNKIKANSSLFIVKMIAKLERTYSNANQNKTNTEPPQTMGVHTAINQQ